MSDLGNREVFSRNLRAAMQLYGKDWNQVCSEFNPK